MNGAHEYAGMFRTGQYGKLYIVSGEHARGRYFHVYVLPQGADESLATRSESPPRSREAVEVYGIKGGHPGWTEYYGWLHDGPWKQDFYDLVARREKFIAEQKAARAQAEADAEAANAARTASLLSAYSEIGGKL